MFRECFLQTYFLGLFHIILNTDVYAKSGQHWCAFYLNANGKAEFFDSFGRKPSYYNNHFSAWLRKYARTFVYNTKRIQSDTSNVCGLYTLHFLRQRLLGHSLETIVDYFSPYNFYANDFFIYQYMQLVFSNCTYNDHVCNQTCVSSIKF